VFDVLTIPDLIGPEQCLRIVSEIKTYAGKPAAVYGSSHHGTIDPRVRQVTRVSVSNATIDSVVKVLTKITPQLSTYFDAELTEIEPPQFLHYRPGDFFVAHQDGNTPLVHDETRFRKVSVVIFLNGQTKDEQAGYQGGSLVLHGSYPNYDSRHTVPPIPGSLVAVRSEVTHEVTPIEAGERFTIVSWYRSAE
jgi:SM-20-related protein